MISSAKNVRLTPVDELFSTEESRADAQRERVVELPLAELHPFKDHPFKVLDDEKMQDTAQSIREHGVLVPAIVRPREEGGYEIVAGHRRHHASHIAGLDTMPAIIHNHIIFHSVNLDCDRKFRNFFNSTRALHRLSDTICIENGYSIVADALPSLQMTGMNTFT